MSYTPGAEPAEVLRLALALAEEARKTQLRFEEDRERGDDAVLWQLGAGVEALLPMIELVDELAEVLRPASDRWDDWQERGQFDRMRSGER